MASVSDTIEKTKVALQISPDYKHVNKEWHTIYPVQDKQVLRGRVIQIKGLIPIEWSVVQRADLIDHIDLFEKYTYYNSSSKAEYNDEIKQKFFEIRNIITPPPPLEEEKAEAPQEEAGTGDPVEESPNVEESV